MRRVIKFLRRKVIKWENLLFRKKIRKVVEISKVIDKKYLQLILHPRVKNRTFLRLTRSSQFD
jgi:hypothetical protein